MFSGDIVKKMIRKILSAVMALAVCVSSVDTGHAAGLALPDPGRMISLTAAFHAPILKGVRIYPQDPFRMDFIMDQGGVSGKDPEGANEDANRMIRYFLTSLTIPQTDLWVNLSPYEKDRITTDVFGRTEMGRDLLAQDYILKQLTSSMIYPEGDTGRAFWAEVYRKAIEKYGTSDIPVDTFNKVWIVPARSLVYEKEGAAYVVESRLKVMLEADYLATSKEPLPTGGHVAPQGYVSPSTLPSDLALNAKATEGTTPTTSELSRQILREVIIPVLEKEVNEGESFAPLRQVYNSFLLAAWFKKKILSGIKDAPLGFYVDQQKTAGVLNDDPEEKQAIYARYVEAFRQGVFNYVKDEQDAVTGEIVPRKYFAGGMHLNDDAMSVTKDDAVVPKNDIAAPRIISVELDPAMKGEFDNTGILKEGSSDPWAKVIWPTKDPDLFGKTVEIDFPMGQDLIDSSYGYFQRTLVFPDGFKPGQKASGLGQKLEDIRCIALIYDGDGNVIGMIFRAMGQDKVPVRITWEIRDGVWVASDKVIETAWWAFTAPQVKYKNMTVKTDYLIGRELIILEVGSWQGSVVFPNGWKPLRKSLGFGTNYSDIRCTSLKYDGDGHVVAMYFQASKDNKHFALVWEQMPDGSWKMKPITPWRTFIAPNVQHAGKIVSVDFPIESDSVNFKEREFQAQFIFPNGWKPGQLNLGIGARFNKLHCTSLVYDKEGSVIGVTFTGWQDGAVAGAVTWMKKDDGTWFGRRGAVAWDIFVAQDLSRAGQQVSVDIVLSEELVDFDSGRFQRTFIFPGGWDPGRMSVGLGQELEELRCIGLDYDGEGNVIAVTLRGFKKGKDIGSVVWSKQNDGTWVGIEEMSDWDILVAKDPDLRGQTVSVDFRMDQRLMYLKGGVFQRAFVFPNGWKPGVKTMRLATGLEEVRCTSLSYGEDGSVIAMIFQGKRGKNRFSVTWRQLDNGTWAPEDSDAYIDQMINNDVNVRAAVEALSDQPDVLKAFILATTSLTPEQVGDIVRRAFVGTHGIGNILDISNFSVNDEVAIEVASPEPFAERSVTLFGTVGQEFFEQGFKEIHISGARKREVVVNDDGTFKVSFNLSFGETAEILMVPFDRRNRVRGTARLIELRQISPPKESIDVYLELLSSLSEDLLDKLSVDPGRLDMIVRRIERGLLGHFTEDEEAGFNELKERIKTAPNKHVRKILQSILLRFQMIRNAGGHDLVDGERLYFYQKYAIFYIEQAIKKKVPGMVLALEQGLGKTLVAMVLGRMSPKGALVVAPNAVASSWGEMYGHFFGDKRLAVASGTYEERLMTLLDKSNELRVVPVSFFRKDVSDMRFSVMSRDGQWVLVDESHFMTREDSLQSQGVREVGGNFKLLISATPVAKPDAVRSVMYYLTNERGFANSGAFKKWRETQGVDGYRKLHFQLDQYMVRIRKEDVFKTYDSNIPLQQQKDRLPVKRYITPEEDGVFELTEAQSEALLEIFTDWDAWQANKWDKIKEGAAVDTADDQERRTRQSSFARSHAVLQAMDDPKYIGEKAVSPKHAKMKEIVDREVGQGGKVVIFARYKHQIAAYEKMFAPYGAATYYGDTLADHTNADDYLIDKNGKLLRFRKKNKFEFAWDPQSHLIPDERGDPITAQDYSRLKFQNDPNTKVLIASYKAGAVGVTFTAADAMVFDDLPDDYVTLYQAEDRINRIDNQRKKYETRYYSLQARYPQAFLERMRGFAFIKDLTTGETWVEKETNITPEERSDEGLQIHNVYERFFAQGTYDKVLGENLERQKKLFRLVVDGVSEEDQILEPGSSGEGIYSAFADRDDLDPGSGALDVENAQQVENDEAMAVDLDPGRVDYGGIDFNMDENDMQVRTEGQEVEFNVDPAMLEEYRAAPGLVPVIINIRSDISVHAFLGIK